jgi:signal transduction histidine kinase
MAAVGFSAFRRGTIGFRLIIGASLWLAAALAVTYIILSGLFRDTVTRNFDIVLLDHADELLALLEVRPDGAVALRRHPVDPRFVKPGSGWYWTISTGTGWHDRSASLGGRPMPGQSAVADPDPPLPYHVLDHTGEAIRVIGRRERLAGAEVRVLLSGPAVVIEAAAARFDRNLLLGLAGMGLALIAVIVVQIYVALSPLRAIGRSLAEVRAGRTTRLEGGFPEEVAPLVGELNALIDHNQRTVARMRTQVDDLAHALKTPIAALKNAAEDLGGANGEVIRSQVAAMGAGVDHHLARARIAAAGDIIGSRTALRPLAESLRRTVAQIYADKDLEIAIDVTGEPVFRGERQDLTEMLGNLLDNACKWGRRRVRLSGRAVGGELLIEIDDDGPGIPDAARAEALDRGRRLDETKPGSGFGLPIVRDIAAHYKGSLELKGSTDGGVAATLRLPAA